MLKKAIARARRIIGAIMNLFANRGVRANGTTATKDTRYKFQPRALKTRIRRVRRRVRYSYLASARRVHVGSVMLKRFELNTAAGRRIVSRKFKVLKHGKLVAA